MNSGENLQRCRREYVDALEEERRKIQVFPRELPLCLELVTRAIDACRNQLSESESSAKPFNFVSTERAPLTSSSSDLDDEDKENDENGRSTNKSDWLQLWNPQVGDPQTEKGDIPGKSSILMDGRKNCGAFKPFQRERDTAWVRGNNNNSNSTAAPASGRRNPPAVSSSAETVVTVARSSSCSVGSRRELLEKEAHSMSSQRKARRCWSPELHRRFLNALQQLGGAQAATPKQIREFMKVDGLTNDEVKSHLQKYRLHNSKPSSSLNHGDNGGAQAPHHLMAVGGRWGKPPPPENNGAAVAEATSPEGLGAAAPAHLLKLGGCDEERASHSCELGGGGGGCSGSPSTSCSTPLPVV